MTLRGDLRLENGLGFLRDQEGSEMEKERRRSGKDARGERGRRGGQTAQSAKGIKWVSRDLREPVDDAASRFMSGLCASSQVVCVSDCLAGSGLLGRTSAEGGPSGVSGKSRGWEVRVTTFGRELRGPGRLAQSGVQPGSLLSPKPTALCSRMEPFSCVTDTWPNLQELPSPGLESCSQKLLSVPGRRLAEGECVQGRRGAGQGRGLCSSLVFAISDPLKACSSWVSAQMLVTGASLRSLSLTLLLGHLFRTLMYVPSSSRNHVIQAPCLGQTLSFTAAPAPHNNPATCSRPE